MELMTDQYPPFRLDIGGHDPGSLTLLPADRARPRRCPRCRTTRSRRLRGREAEAWLAARRGLAAGRPAGSSRWSPARCWCFSVGLSGAGGTALWAQTQKHGGYVDLGTASYSTPGYALASETVEMHMASGGWDAASALAGTVRVRVTPAGGGGPAFIGIAPAAAADRYLTGVAYATVSGTADHRTYTEHAGSAPGVPPAQAGIWAAQAAGPGTQTLTWTVQSGDWLVVAMNADGSRPVSMRVNVAATLPALPWIAAGLLAGGLACLVGGVLLIAVPLSRASRAQDPRLSDAGRWA